MECDESVGADGSGGVDGAEFCVEDLNAWSRASHQPDFALLTTDSAFIVVEFAYRKAASATAIDIGSYRSKAVLPSGALRFPRLADHGATGHVVSEYPTIRPERPEKGNSGREMGFGT